MKNLLKIIKCFLFLCLTTSQSISVDVLTTSGLIRGKSLNVLNKSINQFLNIPYAEPPIGEHRFAKPKPIQKPIKGFIDGTKPGNSCIQSSEQIVINPLGKDNLTFSEDCLVLNIWSPNDTSKLKPVMFWIYGGALCTGSIFVTLYNGSVLATNDVVMVSVNYRTGPLGFLYGDQESAPGNVGFFDQRLALLWVRENIHLFGGDKNQITLFGESVGGWSVSAHILSPWSKGLFKRAIMQSEALLFNREKPPIDKKEALISAKQLAQNMNCPNDNQWLQCLRGVNEKQFIPLSPVTFPVFGTEFLPNYTQIALKEQNFNKDVDILAGMVQDEGSIATVILPDLYNRTQNRQDFINSVNSLNYVLHNMNIEKTIDFYLNNINESDSNAFRQKIIDLFGDLFFKCPTYFFVKRYVQHSDRNVENFFYYLTYAVYSSFLPGTYHTSDIPLIFGTPLLDSSTTEEDKIFTRNVMKYWTDFAKYGKPNIWKKFIKSEYNSGLKNNFYEIKELNPKYSDKYLHNLFDKTCDGFWSEYF